MLLIVRALCTSDILTSIHVRRNYSRCSVPRCLFSLFMTQLFRNFSRLTLNKKKYNKIKIYTQCNLFSFWHELHAIPICSSAFQWLYKGEMCRVHFLSLLTSMKCSLADYGCYRIDSIYGYRNFDNDICNLEFVVVRACAL